MESSEKTNGYAKKLIELLAKKMNVDISKYDMDELTQGMLVELEHGSQGDATNLTDDDPIGTLKIVLAHMDEIPDYYTRLKKMEDEASSVKTDKPAEEKEDSETEDVEEKDAKNITESVAKRYKELCGIMENNEKKQLKNPIYQEKCKKTLLKEEVDPKKFDIVKFSNDGLGKKDSDEEIDLYKMEKKKG